MEGWSNEERDGAMRRGMEECTEKGKERWRDAGMDRGKKER